MESREQEHAEALMQLEQMRIENEKLKADLAIATTAKDLAEKKYSTSEEQRVAALASLDALTKSHPEVDRKAAEMASLLECVEYIASAMGPVLNKVCDMARKLLRFASRGNPKG